MNKKRTGMVKKADGLISGAKDAIDELVEVDEANRDADYEARKTTVMARVKLDLDLAHEILTDASEGEQQAFDNMNEGNQANSDNEQHISDMDEAVSTLQGLDLDGDMDDLIQELDGVDLSGPMNA